MIILSSRVGMVGRQYILIISISLTKSDIKSTTGVQCITKYSIFSGDWPFLGFCTDNDEMFWYVVFLYLWFQLLFSPNARPWNISNWKVNRSRHVYNLSRWTFFRNHSHYHHGYRYSWYILIVDVERKKKETPTFAHFNQLFSTSRMPKHNTEKQYKWFHRISLYIQKLR